MINGRSLSVIFEDAELSKIINILFKKASAIIVYRSSPSEKAQVVKFVMND